MTFAQLAVEIIKFINTLVALLTVVSTVVFMVGGIRYIYKAGDAKGLGNDKYLMQWGLVAMFVLVSIFGILEVLKNSFNV